MKSKPMCSSRWCCEATGRPFSQGKDVEKPLDRIDKLKNKCLDCGGLIFWRHHRTLHRVESHFKRNKVNNLSYR